MSKYFKLPSLRAHQFTSLLIVVGFLILFEAVFISLRYTKKLSFYFVPLEYACQQYECIPGQVAYLARADGVERKSSICFNGNLVLESSIPDSIHFLIVDSYNMSSYTVESFSLTATGSNKSFEDFKVPLNKFMILVSTSFSRKQLLFEALEAKLKISLEIDSNSSTDGALALSGWMQDEDHAHLEQISHRTENIFIRGCIPLYSGLTTCQEKIECSSGQASYYVKSGSFKDQTVASICYKNSFYVGSKLKGGRGMNVLLINDQTLHLEDVRTFDTYQSGREFDDYLKKVDGMKIIIISTEDDASKSLLPSSRDLLEEFGSSVIRKLDFRDNFVFVGQRGLYSGSAIEKLKKRYVDSAVEIKGCLDLKGIGILRNLSRRWPDATKGSGSIGSPASCMVDGACPRGHFPVSLSTGIKNTVLPSACINGEIIGRSKLGRGMNLIMYNTTSQRVRKAGTFDTFQYENDDIPRFLSDAQADDILFAFTYDDGFRRLLPSAREALGKFGSYYINMTQMRTAWMLIGRLDMFGHSPYEQINYPPYKSYNWSEGINFASCIPSQINEVIRPGIAVENPERLQYCIAHAQQKLTGDFCSGLNRWRSFHHILSQNPDTKRSPVFALPIFVVASSVKDVLQVQLERMFGMAGLVPDNVHVFYNDSIEFHSELIDLFKFKKIALQGKLDLYSSIVGQSSSFHPPATDVIIFEEGVIPTLHYLEYLAYLYDVFKEDDTLCCISGYNHHAFLTPHRTHENHLVFRVSDQLPGLGYLAKLSYLKDMLQSKFQRPSMEALQPEVSYVVQHPRTPGYKGTSPLVRSYARGGTRKPMNFKFLHHKDYAPRLARLINESTPMVVDGDPPCPLVPTTDKNLVTVFHQDRADDFSELQKMSACFSLSSSSDNHTIRGTYWGVFRFTFRSQLHVFLVGSKSQFVDYVRPAAVHPS